MDQGRMGAGATGQDLPRLCARRSSVLVHACRHDPVLCTAEGRLMMRSVILAAALLALSPARADMPFNAEFGDPSDQKREWPDSPVKDFLKGLERPDNDKYPERIT